MGYTEGWKIGETHVPSWERHGAMRPSSDSQMLRHCANFPRALEVLLNAYPHVPSGDTWVEAVLPELWQVCPPQGHRSMPGAGGGGKEGWAWAYPSRRTGSLEGAAGGPLGRRRTAERTPWFLGSPHPLAAQNHLQPHTPLRPASAHLSGTSDSAGTSTLWSGVGADMAETGLCSVVPALWLRIGVLQGAPNFTCCKILGPYH